MSEESIKSYRKNIEDLMIALRGVNAILLRLKYKNEEMDTSSVKRIKRELERLLQQQEFSLKKARLEPPQTDKTPKEKK